MKFEATSDGLAQPQVNGRSAWIIAEKMGRGNGKSAVWAEPDREGGLASTRGRRADRVWACPGWLGGN